MWHMVMGNGNVRHGLEREGGKIGECRKRERRRGGGIRPGEGLILRCLGVRV